jgi:Fic family protein
MMDYADTPRQNDLDGRGNLSLNALKDFTLWFLKVSLDQVTFMSGLFEIEALMAQRFKKYVAQSDTLKPESSRLLEEALMRGEFDRGEAARITGMPERSARRVLNDVVAEGLLASTTEKGPVSLRFPTDSLETFFPRLYVQA